MKIQDKLEGIIEMKPDERKFINGIIRKYKPKKLVEIGIAQGGSSALILNAIKDMPNAKLFSIDKSDVWYRDKSKKVGWLVKERFQDLMDKWALYTNVNTAEIIETIGNIGLYIRISSQYKIKLPLIHLFFIPYILTLQPI